MLKSYYRYIQKYTKLRLVIESASIGIVGKVFIGFIMAFICEIFLGIGFFEIWDGTGLTNEGYGAKTLVIWIGVAIPFLETTTQLASILLLKKIIRNYLCILLCSALIFSFLHLSYSVIYAVIMLPIGFVLAWVFYCECKKSILEAYVTTSFVHSVINIIAVFFMMLPGF